MKPYKGMENDRGRSSYIRQSRKTFPKRDVSKEPNEMGEKEQQAHDLEAAGRTHHSKNTKKASMSRNMEGKGEKQISRMPCQQLKLKHLNSFIIFSLVLASFQSHARTASTTIPGCSATKLLTLLCEQNIFFLKL